MRRKHLNIHCLDTNVEEKHQYYPCFVPKFVLSNAKLTHQYFSSQVNFKNCLQMLVGYLPKWLVESTNLSATAKKPASVWLAVTSQYCR